MDQITNQIEDLKEMQNNPKFYLVKYFCELKLNINSIFGKNQKNNESREKYLEIIKGIESFEKYICDKIKPFNTFDEEIKLFEKKLDNQSSSHLDELNKEIDEIKFKIESKMFSNKSAIFLIIMIV